MKGRGGEEVKSDIERKVEIGVAGLSQCETQEILKFGSAWWTNSGFEIDAEE
jgi:hypothetical protein